METAKIFLTQEMIDTPGKAFESRTTVKCEKKDIDGADLIKLIARSLDRQSKVTLLADQHPEQKKEKSPIGSRWPWLLLGLALSYFSVHVIVAIVRGVVR